MPYLSYLAGLVDFKSYFGSRMSSGRYKYKIFLIKFGFKDIKVAKKIMKLLEENGIEVKLYKEGNVYSVQITKKEEMLKFIKLVKRYVIVRKKELEKFEKELKQN